MFTSNQRPVEKNADLVLVPDTSLGDRYNLDGPIVWIPSVVRSAPAWQVQQRVLGRSCFRQFSDEIDDILIVVTNLSTRTPHVHREDQPHLREPSRLAGILFYPRDAIGLFNPALIVGNRVLHRPEGGLRNRCGFHVDESQRETGGRPLYLNRGE